MKKQDSRLRRAKKSRGHIKRLGMPRLSIYRTPRHIYAQIVMINGSIAASASTVEKEVKSGEGKTGNVDAAKRIGSLIAERAIKANIKKVAFDRSGYKYHGRVKALADAARESGLEF